MTGRDLTWVVVATGAAGLIRLGGLLVSLLILFARLGRTVRQAFLVLRALVPNAQLVIALTLVRQGAVAYVDNAQRRAWVVAELRTRCHVPESVARLLCEIAVAQVKHALAADAPPVAAS